MLIAFRTDASLEIGTGHVMRCLTLADALRETGASCHFLCRAHPGNLAAPIEQRGHTVHMLPAATTAPDGDLPYAAWLGCGWREDAAQSRAILDRISPQWLVADHYALDAEWEKAARPDGAQLLVIDDLTDRFHDGDYLINNNLDASAEDYRSLTPPGMRFYVGPRYAFVQPSFRARRRDTATLPFDRWLACVGGVDQHDVLGTVLKAWAAVKSAKPSLSLAVGANSPNAGALKEKARNLPGATVHTGKTDLSELMAGSDLIIASAGTISWERCCIGLPAIMGITADNQRGNLAGLARRRTGISIGDWRGVKAVELADLFARVMTRPCLLARMARRARQVTDGRGADRIALLLSRDRLELRKATADDTLLVHVWRNHPETRRYFHNPDSISFGEHEAWWKKTITSKTQDLLIGKVGNIPAGVLRLDRDGTEARVSVYLDPALTGLGLGARVLRAGAAWCRQHRPAIRKLAAEILPQNNASQSAFREAGFVGAGDLWTLDLYD